MADDELTMTGPEGDFGADGGISSIWTVCGVGRWSLVDCIPLRMTSVSVTWSAVVFLFKERGDARAEATASRTWLPLLPNDAPLPVVADAALGDWLCSSRVVSWPSLPPASSARLRRPSLRWRGTGRAMAQVKPRLKTKAQRWAADARMETPMSMSVAHP